MLTWISKLSLILIRRGINLVLWKKLWVLLFSLICMICLKTWKIVTTRPGLHYMYVPRERPPFSALNFRSGAYHFHKLPKISVPEHHHFTFFGGFCRSGDHNFQNFFNFNPFIAFYGRLSPNAPRVSGRPERQPDASWPFSRLKTDQARSGALHFQAQNGSSSFRRPAFARSTGSSFRSPGPFFTLPRHIPTKIWGEYPPPPPGGGV